MIVEFMCSFQWYSKKNKYFGDLENKAGHFRSEEKEIGGIVSSHNKILRIIFISQKMSHYLCLNIWWLIEWKINIKKNHINIEIKFLIKLFIKLTCVYLS